MLRDLKGSYRRRGGVYRRRGKGCKELRGIIGHRGRVGARSSRGQRGIKGNRERLEGMWWESVSVLKVSVKILQEPRKVKGKKSEGMLESRSHTEP